MAECYSAVYAARQSKAAKAWAAQMSRRKTGRITIKDIARKVGLSPMTVSRALRADSAIRPETRARVQRAAEASGYVPNLVAVSLASNRSNTIGVIIPTLLDSIYASTVEAVGRVLGGHGYEFILGSSGYDGASEERFIKTFLRRRVDGLVLPAIDHTKATRTMLRAAGVPVVEIGNIPAAPIGHVVGFSNEAASHAAAAHLIRSGCRRLAFIGGHGEHNANGRDRLAGFHRALAEHGQAVRRGQVLMVDYDAQTSLAPIRAFLGRLDRCDGLLVAGEIWSPLVMLECLRQGISVPDELSVIGIGEVELSDLLPCPLTTVTLPREQAGALSAECIVRLCRGETVAPRVQELDFTLHERASVRARQKALA